MPGTTFNFRCPECRKLLAVSRSRVGLVVSCPRCRSDLIVPEPSEEGSSEQGVSPSSELQPAITSPPPNLSLAPAPRAPRSAPEPAPIFPPILIEDEPLSLRPGRSERSHRIPNRSGTEEPPASSAPVRSSDSDNLAVREPAPRRNDVVLPRTGVILWSFVMLLALIFAFTTGLLAGRFLWSSPAPIAVPAPLPAAPPPSPTLAEGVPTE